MYSAKNRKRVFLSLKIQSYVIAIIPVLCILLVFLYLSISTLKDQAKDELLHYREALMTQKKEALKNYVNVAIKAISRMPLLEAKEHLKTLRYEDENYFWLNDFNHFMVSHPFPQLDQSDQTNLKDPKGVMILQEIVKRARENGEGYVSYIWKKKKDDLAPSPKLSYIKVMKDWNVIIGTGIYTDDVEQLIRREEQRKNGDIAVLTKKIIFISLLISVLIIFAVRLYVDKTIGRPTEAISSHLHKFNNNLTTRIPRTTDNELGDLAVWFNNHMENLEKIIKRVSEAVGGINAYAGEIAQAVEQQAATATEQSASVAEITSTMEELSASSSQIAEHSTAVLDHATKTWQETKEGAAAVDSVMAKMNEIHRESQHSMQEIVDLGKKSKEITKIMEIINNIADQTKLIAFNAAIEASSAGEAGKRFGVVAVEIRRLADNVMESTGEIETKVNEIQEAINRLVIASEKGANGIREGMEYSGRTAGTLDYIVDAAQETTDAAKQISLSTQQQKTASNQVLIALKEIVTGSSQTTEAINQINRVSKDMARMSDALMALVKQFKLREAS